MPDEKDDPNVFGNGGKIVSAVTGPLQSSPLAIALLVVNCAFLAFAGYVLGEVAQGSRERNLSQTELIGKLVTDIRDCRAGPRS